MCVHHNFCVCTLFVSATRFAGSTARNLRSPGSPLTVTIHFESKSDTDTYGRSVLSTVPNCAHYSLLAVLNFTVADAVAEREQRSPAPSTKSEQARLCDDALQWGSVTVRGSVTVLW